MHVIRERIALVAATVLTVGGSALVPSWDGWVVDVCHHAVIVGLLVMGGLYALRQGGPRAVRLERLWCALFLAGMPLVYVIAWLTTGRAAGHGVPLAVELAGVPIYGGLAWLGLRRSPWFMAAGIAAHGVAWDAWHHPLAASAVPAWYSMACLLADVGLALYVAARAEVWNEAARVQQGGVNEGMEDGLGRGSGLFGVGSGRG